MGETDTADTGTETDTTGTDTTDTGWEDTAGTETDTTDTGWEDTTGTETDTTDTGWEDTTGTETDTTGTDTTDTGWEDTTGTETDTTGTGWEDTSGTDLSPGRQEMLDLINKWMPTSLLIPRIPDGETEDLMAKAGWTKAKGVKFKQDKDAGGKVTTSCGDILSAMLRLWRSNFVGAFMIRDLDSRGKKPGAKDLGFYVEANGANAPRPGDIIVLRNGVGPSSSGSVGHVGILVQASTDVWQTADGGGGALPEQTATVTERTVRFDDKNIPILRSPTDGREKQVDGWVDLDKLTQSS